LLYNRTPNLDVVAQVVLAVYPLCIDCCDHIVVVESKAFAYHNDTLAGIGLAFVNVRRCRWHSERRNDEHNRR
jgi:hypothetical protein